MTIPASEALRSILVDTSAFYALLDRSDQWQGLATEGLHTLAKQRRRLRTTSLILAETHTLALCRLGFPVAQRWLEALEGIGIICLESRHAPVVTRLPRKTAGQGYSFADAFSFIAMEESRIGAAFTFDRHFGLYGVDVFP